MNSTYRTMSIGIGATVIVDIFTFIVSLFTEKSHGIQFIGRWIAYLFKGRVYHNTIIETPPFQNEIIIGWVTQYIIGVLFAFVLILLYSKKWLFNPQFIPALIIGCGTLAFPIFVLQPVLGFGVAFSNITNSERLLIKIISIHIVYGTGLYLTAFILKKHYGEYNQSNKT